MSREDDEWAGWARDFQGSAAADDATTPAAMLERVRRETWKQRRAYLGEALACVFLIAFYVVMMGRLRATWFVVMASANFVFVALWMGYLTHALRGTWSAAGADAHTFVALTRARRAAEQRWFRFSRAITALMLLFVVAWAPFVLRARWERFAAEPWRAFVGFGLALLIGVATMVHQTRRLERAGRELAALDEAAAE